MTSSAFCQPALVMGQYQFWRLVLLTRGLHSAEPQPACNNSSDHIMTEVNFYFMRVVAFRRGMRKKRIRDVRTHSDVFLSGFKIRYDIMIFH